VPKRALITNDDGIDSPGLHALAAAASTCDLDIVVVAPVEQASGTGAGLGATADDGGVHIEPRQLPGLPQVRAHAISAHPGFIALAAMTGRFGSVPDVVLSGINDGANLGTAVPHSGTLGAALVGGVHGARAMAVSIAAEDHDTMLRWQTAADVTSVLLPALLDAPAKTVLNLNVPNLEPQQLAPLRRAALSNAGIVQTVTRFITGLDDDASSARDGAGQVRIPGKGEPEPGSDVALLSAGHPTLVSLRSADDGDDLGIPERWDELWTVR
jgi:5'-nucleotidase